MTKLWRKIVCDNTMILNSSSDKVKKLLLLVSLPFVHETVRVVNIGHRVVNFLT